MSPCGCLCGPSPPGRYNTNVPNGQSWKWRRLFWRRRTYRELRKAMASHGQSKSVSPLICCDPLALAFGFINLVLWAGNLWFVFKETGIIAPFMRAPPPQAKPAPDAYGQQGAYEQDPYASNQGGYQPDYSQQGYNQDAEYGQGYVQQGAPTSFSNQM